jgi:hypothetical protein
MLVSAAKLWAPPASHNVSSATDEKGCESSKYADKNKKTIIRGENRPSFC